MDKNLFIEIHAESAAGSFADVSQRKFTLIPVGMGVFDFFGLPPVFDVLFNQQHSLKQGGL